MNAMRRILYFMIIVLWACSAPAQLFTPVLTRPYDGPFGSSGPQPFFRQNAAVNYDFGGQGVGYKVPSPSCVGNTCAAGAAAYRADSINFKSSSFGSGFNFQLGFNVSPNVYNYTISITQPGPYVVTLWVGSSSAGGSWNVLIDNNIVGNVTTPNTGSYSVLTASTSSQFTATLGTHTMTLAWGSGDGFGAAGDIVAWQGSVPSSQVPPPAAAAGLSTQVLNADFSQPSYANLANWLDGCGGPTTGVRWAYTLYLDGNRTHGQPPCSRIDQEIDSSIGKNVLHFQARNGDSSYPSDPNGQNGINLSWPQAAGAQGTVTIGIEMYVKILFKLSSASLTQTPVPPHIGSNAYYVMNFFGVSNTGPATWIEPDFLEVIANSNTGSGWIYGDGTIEFSPGDCFSLQNCLGLFSSPPSGLTVDETAYHTIGSLLTSDGTQFAKCYYLDGEDAAHKLGCWKFTARTPSDLTAVNQTITLGIGQTDLVNNVDLYVQNVQVWMCANWQTQACTGTLVYP